MNSSNFLWFDRVKPQIECTAGMWAPWIHVGCQYYKCSKNTLCIISKLSATRKLFNTCLSGSSERVFSPITLLYLGVLVESVTQFLFLQYM